MEVDFYFDPSCPFCWVTSRWLHVVISQRDLKVNWLPFSLALKNKELEDDVTEHSDAHRGSHRVLRVMQAARQEHGASFGELYTSFGRQFHVAERDYDDDLIREVLAEMDLPEILLAEADIIEHDEALQDSLESAIEVAGDDIGVPVIVFNTPEGKNGFFGPVLQALPSELEDSLKLWDGLSQLATDTNFYELKRTRPTGGPGTHSTARC